MKKVFIGGIQGVGKSTICRELALSDNIGHFSFGDKIKENMRDVIGFEKKIHSLSDIERQNIIDSVREELNLILDATSKDIFLFDNHFTVFRNNTLLYTFNSEEILFYDRLVLISLPVDIIVDRILKDPNKERTDLSCDINFIEKHLNFERSRAYYLANRYNLKLLSLINLDFEETINSIKNFIYE